MKKVLFFVVAMAVSCALAGCNVAPNVTPYLTPGYNTVPGYSTTTPGAYGNYVGRGAIGNNKTGGNRPATGRYPAYIPGSQSYGLR